MDLAGSSDSSLLGWCILAVDGDQSVVKLVKLESLEHLCLDCRYC